MLDRLGGDDELLVDVISLFLDETPRMRADVREAVGSQDPARVRLSAHSLRGALLNISAEPAAASAGRLEQLGEQGDLNGAEPALAELEQELTRLTRELKSATAG